MRDRGKTEQKLLEAVTALVVEEGFQSLRVNSVAQRAGVSKILIYRYFGDLNGLIETWALRHNYWAETAETAQELLQKTPIAEYPILLKDLLNRQSEHLRKSFLKREILRWMLVEDSPPATGVLEKVEDLGAGISRTFRKNISTSGDIEAAVAVLIGGLYYLTLISDRTPSFNDVDLRSDEGWKRIESAVNLMIDTFFNKRELPAE